MPSNDANPLRLALTGSFTVPDSDAPATGALPERTLGEKVLALGLIAPTLLNWAALPYARWVGTAELLDSDGWSYATPRFRNYNFEDTFFVTSVACISNVFAHI